MEIDKKYRDLTGIQNNEVWLSPKQVTVIENIIESTFYRRFRVYQYTYRYVQSANGGKGGKRLEIALSSLSPEGQERYVQQNRVSEEALGGLSPALALSAAQNSFEENHLEAWTEERAIGTDVINDPRVGKWARVIQEANKVPAGWKKRTWIETVAIKHGTTFQSVYRQMGKYRAQGLAGLKHRKPTQRLAPRSWSPEAVDFWVGLCLRREHRKISKKALYRVLISEAHKRGWRIGAYSSALWWHRHRVTPQLMALQRGGFRALDNSLPPVLRDYSDLEPFEILVGDQHRFDFWVTDDDTGAVFRPEGYFWQDLRTRCFYGGALDRRYDAHLMGLALRMGMKIFGAFGSIYTDHGKPEESNYIIQIKKSMREYGLFAERTVDLPADLTGADAEEINPHILMPGTHVKAVVRNAKAKMIEGRFNTLEGVLRNEFRLPGSVKILAGPDEENEVDQKDIARLAAAGKLLTMREFSVALLKALDHCNNKPHRGVRREWNLGSPPIQPTPMDCLRACHANGWRPVFLSNEAVDLLFLPQATRTINRGRITWKDELYEHPALVELPNGRRVTIRFDPMDWGWLLIFSGGEFLCRAEPAEFSSMKDKALAARKIEEKRRLRGKYIEQYRELTAPVPDFRRYSEVPAAERVAAQVGAAKQQRIAEQQELARVRTAEELEEEIKRLEAGTPGGREANNGQQRTTTDNNGQQVSLPARPEYFLTDYDRFKWLVGFELQGGVLDEEDAAFKQRYEARMNEGEREHWQMVRELERAGAQG
jgi:putative transposase